MNEDVKEFIEQHIKLIENNEWKEVYNEIDAYNSLPASSVGEFTSTMLEVGINPLEYLDSVPGYYLFDSSVGGRFVIPGYIMHIDIYAFYKCRHLTSIIIPDSVTSMGDCAFYGCSSLTNITIPGGVKWIDDYAFRECNSLTNIVIPDSVISIGSQAFCNCINLTNVTIGNSVTSIGNDVFYGCKKLKDIYYNGTKEQWENIKKNKNWTPKYGGKHIHCSDGIIKI